MQPNNITLKITFDLPLGQLVELYSSVGWLAYTSIEQQPKLQEAIRNSSYVVTAWDEAQLVGLARCISDDVSICYLQDILVHPSYQRQHIGRQLLIKCLERYQHVRTKVLLTDNEQRQQSFYKSLGYKNTKDLQKIQLNVFVQMNNVVLE